MPMARNPFPTLALLLLCTAMQGQTEVDRGGKRVEILHADEWTFNERIAPGAQRLLGNVRFRHAQAIMQCDSAYMYDDQRVDAFGHVTMDQGDTLHVEAERLRYDGRNRMARLEGNVILRDKDMELVTPALDYNMKGGRATYDQGGRITSRKEGNTLTSQGGTYFADLHRFVFSRNVRLEHPERLILSDTMHYATGTGITEFFGPTEIQQHTDSTLIRTLRGTFDTRTGLARFTRRSSILSKGRLLEGDTLHYDQHSGTGLAWGNVSVTDTANKVLARGRTGRYDEIHDRSMITGHAELILMMDGDSLFLHGDSLFTTRVVLQDSHGGSREAMIIKAYRNVRFYKSDMQGACDTLVYSAPDSLIRMFHQPVLWTEADQITGDHIRIALREGKPHQLHVEGNAFLLSAVDTVLLDQVAGSTMTGYFQDEALRRIIAEGNGRTVYFAREEKNGMEELIGMNKAECSRISVELEDGQVNTVTFLDRPDAILYPMNKIPDKELRMEGAVWRMDERPRDRQDIFRR